MDIILAFVSVFMIILGASQIIVSKARVGAVKRGKAIIRARVRALPEFEANKALMASDGRSAIYLDENRKAIWICAIGPDMTILERLVPYKGLLSVEIFVDGSTLTKTVRSSQVGGAIVGGLLLGGAGSIVGGLSGSTLASKTVNRVDLRLIVDDTSHPLHDISLVNIPKSGVSTTNTRYQQAMQIAREWNGILQIIIKRADEEDKLILPACTDAAQIFVSRADELNKLAALRDSDVLTVEEFESEKRRLLGHGRQSRSASESDTLRESGA